jgi:aryl-alcohol dehydrogenase-like predicted oxidoreductase
LLSRGVEAAILPAVRELKIPLVAYGVLSRGLISNGTLHDGGIVGEVRSRMPRFSAQNFPHNRALIEQLSTIAKLRGASVAQLAFAWMRSRGNDIVPLIGARRRDQLTEALAGLAIVLTPDELRAIEQAAPNGAVAGERYGPAAMKHLDSELAV